MKANKQNKTKPKKSDNENGKSLEKRAENVTMYAKGKYKIAKRNIKQKQKYLKFIRNEKRENAIKINFKNTKYTNTHFAVLISLIFEQSVDRAQMRRELNSMLAWFCSVRGRRDV